MFRRYYHFRARTHARRLLRKVFPNGYLGEFFLCGGAFKPILNKRLSVNDLDLWVRNRKEREKLCIALLDRGAVLVRDFHPYCLKFRLDGQIIEITYHNVKDGALADILNTFDLSVSGMGARYEGGNIVETYISEECWQAMHRREVGVMESNFCLFLAQKTPSLLRTLHRMGQQATELGYTVNLDCEHRLWDIYWHDYSEEERRAAMDLYFETMVAYKGQQNDQLMQRAGVAYAPVVRQQVDLTPVQLRRHAA